MIEKTVDTAMMRRSGIARWLAPVTVISIAQLFGTSLWFSANGAASDLMRAWHVSTADIGWLTSAVQAGFIAGTLTIALTGAADRFRASAIFFASAVAGAIFNACFAWLAQGMGSAMVLRFCVGICLAGIYPMGMKLVVGWAPEEAGAALAQLVAMLTLGTDLPYLLRVAGADLSWQWIITGSSVLALFGALMVGSLGDGKDGRATGAASDRRNAADSGSRSVLPAFRIKAFRTAAYGYFGHMWELYAFWAIVPLLVSHSGVLKAIDVGGVYGVSFLVIGVGALGCLAGGWWSRRVGSARVAATALALSGLCAVAFAFGWRSLPPVALFVLLLVWGAAVIADSPQFSAVSAQGCPRDLIGAALAIQSSIGFAITVVAIPATTKLFEVAGLDAVWLLVPGPVLGLVGFYRGVQARAAQRLK
ncbi:MFS transporter [Paraburkholderia sp. ZP32-5]|uniref:MFS transporter n=1 Tax=Paraburkholderia sp. ZP32-5 TaxID=2883245 RepID=UPI001F29D133|nr:MFS transporter [Paraburkholderia sp. ZP32-5]